MSKNTLLKVFAVLAVAAIAFASFTSLGGNDKVSDSSGLPVVTGNAGEAPTINLQQVQHQQHCKLRTSS